MGFDDFRGRRVSAGRMKGCRVAGVLRVGLAAVRSGEPFGVTHLLAVRF